MSVVEIIGKVRSQISSKTIRGLSKIFKEIDSNGNRKIDSLEFFEALNTAGCNLSQGEVNLLIQAFDSDKDGSINFDEFLIGLRGKMNPKRQAVCDGIFLLFKLNEEK